MQCIMTPQMWAPLTFIMDTKCFFPVKLAAASLDSFSSTFGVDHLCFRYMEKNPQVFQVWSALPVIHLWTIYVLPVSLWKLTFIYCNECTWFTLHNTWQGFAISPQMNLDHWEYYCGNLYIKALSINKYVYELFTKEWLCMLAYVLSILV